MGLQQIDSIDGTQLVRIEAAQLLLDRVCRQSGIHNDGCFGQRLLVSCVFGHIMAEGI